MNTKRLRELDKKHLWHPFTQMADWCASNHDPLIIASGTGAALTDSEGKVYLDGNSSIWTNIHGHNHPHISSAIRHQLNHIAHCSALGATNESAVLLAEKLVSLFPEKALPRVFFTDNGSTAVECACKMALQYRQLTGKPERRRFISFQNAYHGDTAGAGSLGGISDFHGRFSGTGFEVVFVPDFQILQSMGEDELATITALCIEPLIQGAAGMKIWPPGLLRQLRTWCDRHGILLILDEVMTAFGRTGKMFACEHEGVVPDFLCLAKGLTGGYLPLAATMTTEKVFEAFLGGADRTFFYGHSYCGNPLGCAAALANLEIFEIEKVFQRLPAKISLFEELLGRYLYRRENVMDIRQIGLIAGIEIGPYDPEELMGAKVCRAARKYGLLTRPIRDTLILMPPLCSTEDEIQKMVEAITTGLGEVTGYSGKPADS